MRGSRVFVADLSNERLAAAKKLGAADVINAREQDLAQILADATDGEGADLTVDAVGSGITKKTSLDALRPGGASVWIGLFENTVTIDSYGITLPEKQVFGTYAAKIEDLRTALDLMSSGKVDAQSWVQKFPLADGVEAFHRMLSAKGTDIKAVVCP
jgi:threonine dehydrogenase-like Zn-dependent dehydrogenase